MKKLLCYLLPVLLAVPFLSFDVDSLVHRSMPLLPNKTLDGQTIDANYYKGHVTIVTFMFIGCAPCMNEINTLNRLKKHYAGNDRLQILCVARQMRDQMILFNSRPGKKYDTTQAIDYAFLRKTMGADSITYTIQPGCNDGKSKMEVVDGERAMRSECTTLGDVYGVKSFPTMFYVDKQGIIQAVHIGGPGSDDKAFYADIEKEVDVLLGE